MASVFKSLLGTDLPIVQAPMAGVQLGGMAIAVSEAGGVGSLPCALLSPHELANELAAIKARTTRPYNVNFFCHAPSAPDLRRDTAWRGVLAKYYREFALDQGAVLEGRRRQPFDVEALAVLSQFKPPVVSFHFGLPSSELLAPLRAWGATILSSATTVEEALWLEQQGVDAIIAQGLEAGGHRAMFMTDDIATQMGTIALVRQVVQAVKVPVLAAGGIADAAGVAAAMALGACGVQVGTAYLLCTEATTNAVHRAALKERGGQQSALTNIFTGRPARGLVNRLMQELGAMRADVPKFPLAAQALAPLRAKAESAGVGDFSPLWAGQNTSTCREMSAADMTRQLAVGL